MDIGGTKIEAVALSAAGAVEARIVVPTVPGPEAVLASALHVVTTLAAETNREVRDFTGVGIGVPGQVDRATGTVRNAYNMGLSELRLGPELTARTGVPTFLDNDVTAAAIGAAHVMGRGAGSGTIAYLNLGTGLAAGLIVDGIVVRGADGFAGEIGHLPISPLGRACPCGQLGCLETVASGSALKAHWPGAGEHPGRVLLQAIAAGDESAREAFGLLVEGAATAVRVLGLTLNPDAIIIGGGLRLLGDPLFSEMHGTLERWATESEFLAALKLSARLKVLPEGSPAAAIGAAIAASA